MLSTFEHLPNDTQVWIYAFDHKLGEEESSHVRRELEQFLAEWNSHGEPVDGRFHILEEQLVIIAGRCTGGISGCSIDSKIRIFKDLQTLYGLNALGGARMVYRNPDGKIEVADRAEFRRMVGEGAITGKTGIINLSIRTLGELRTLNIETPFTESWAYSAFGQSAGESNHPDSNMI